MKNRLILYFLVLWVPFSCSKSDDETNAAEDVSISPIALNYLNEVLITMQAHSINRKNIDWNDFRKEVFDRAKDAQTITDTYFSIRHALVLLNDNHSLFIKPDGDIIFVGGLRCGAAGVTSPTLSDNIGYVKVNSFSGDSQSTDALAFANEIQDQIRNSDNPELEGWIVDLRGNGGGNMWPMLAGVGPVLGEGIAGYFIDPDGYERTWGYESGTSIFDGVPATQLDNFYTLINPNPKVAVLLDKGIASSGEVMAVSFIGRENTRSFGTSTCGLSTSNSQFTFSDNSVLYLTTSYQADRNKNIFGGPIEPDQLSSTDGVVQDAIDWIED